MTMREIFPPGLGWGYVSLWNKYRPAIINLMIGAAEREQQYKFFNHEFKGLNPGDKKGHMFTLQVYKGRAENNIRLFLVAQDLLQVLTSSKTASELMEKNRYQISMDKHFMLQVRRMETEPTGSAGVTLTALPPEHSSPSDPAQW